MAGTKAIQHDRERVDKIADQAAKLLKEGGAVPLAHASHGAKSDNHWDTVLVGTHPKRF